MFYYTKFTVLIDLYCWTINSPWNTTSHGLYKLKSREMLTPSKMSF